jgi:hypothetical protein
MLPGRQLLYAMQLYWLGWSWYVPDRHVEHTTSLLVVALVEMYVPTAHVLTAWHTVCPLTFLNEPAAQALHTRSVLVVGAAASYCPTAQVDTAVQLVWFSPRNVTPGVHDTHCRSEVEVGATDSCRPGPHTVSVLHTRSVVAVLAITWYCVLLHTVRALHRVSERMPHGALVYCDELHVEQLRHTRDVLDVHDTDSYCVLVHTGPQLEQMASCVLLHDVLYTEQFVQA